MIITIREPSENEMRLNNVYIELWSPQMPAS